MASIFEYVASWLLEKLFHMKLWDYSHLKGNIQGRVAPQISFFWGIGVVLLVKFVQPFIQRIINWEESWTHGMLALIIVLVMGTDTILSVISVENSILQLSNGMNGQPCTERNCWIDLKKQRQKINWQLKIIFKIGNGTLLNI